MNILNAADLTKKIAIARNGVALIIEYAMQSEKDLQAAHASEKDKQTARDLIDAVTALTDIAFSTVMVLHASMGFQNNLVQITAQDREERRKERNAKPSIIKPS